jgi:hypothetical protein
MRPRASRTRLIWPKNPPISNYDVSGKPLSPGTIARTILYLTGNWPRRVDSNLFAINPNGQLRRLATAADLCSWIGMVTDQPLYLKSGRGYVKRSGLRLAILAHCEPISMDELQELAARRAGR